MSPLLRKIHDLVMPLLPAEMRPDVLRLFERLSKLAPDDELLVWLELCGVLTLMVRVIPEQLAEQRKGWEAVLEVIRAELSRQLTDTETRMAQGAKLLDRSLQTLTDTSSVMVEAGKAIRQAILDAAKRIDVDRISTAVTGRLEEALQAQVLQPLGTLTAALRELPGVTQRTKETLDELKRFHLRSYWRNTALTSLLLVVGGLGFGWSQQQKRYDERIAAEIAAVNHRASESQAAFEVLNLWGRSVDVHAQDGHWFLTLDGADDAGMGLNGQGYIRFSPFQRTKETP